MQQGHLFVFSGPSGVGKGTICNELVKCGDALLSVSMTTRAPRSGEIEGESYYFVSREEFDKTVENGGLLEHCEIYGNCYGTPKGPVLEQLKKGKDVILEIEMQGAMQVKKNYPDAVLVFVLPPSLEVLKERLLKRGTESEEQLHTRLMSAADEIEKLRDYDFYVVNGDLQEAVAQSECIMKAFRTKIGSECEDLVKQYKEEM